WSRPRYAPDAFWVAGCYHRCIRAASAHRMMKRPVGRLPGTLESRRDQPMRKLAAVLAAGALVLSYSLAFAADLNLTFGPGRDATPPGSAQLVDNGAVGFPVNLTMPTAGPGGADASQPAHIHAGTCPGVGAVEIPLTNVVGLKSTTSVTNKTLASVLTTPHSINVHQSTSAAGIYTACI